MYCGNNKTALSSLQAISSALLLLMEDHPFSEISICQICKEAGVSRQTFYSLFQSKENVISYELRKNYCFTIENTSCEESFSLAGLCKAYSRYIEDQRDFLSLLVRNNIMECMKQSIQETFCECGQFMASCPENERVYAVDFLASGLTSIAGNFVLYGPEDDTDFLEEMIFKLFSGSLLNQTR